MPKVYQIPKGCPPELRELIETMGTKQKVFSALGVPKDTFTRVVNGGEKMPDSWLSRIEQVKHGGAMRGPDAAPDFVPWDGTTRSFTLPARGGKKGAIFKKAPSMAVDLLEKFEGNVSKAARSMGVTSNTLRTIVDGSVEFDGRRQRLVYAGLHGGLPAMNDVEGPDQFSLGMAVVLVAAKNFDRVRDVADLCDGRVLFKLSTPIGWFVVYKMKEADARKFKRVAERDCSKLVCP
jgi:plasmid maintenance system antidote protein VapI